MEQITFSFQVRLVTYLSFIAGSRLMGAWEGFVSCLMFDTIVARVLDL